MKVTSNDIYVSGEYLTNNPDWGITDARWKTDVIMQLLKKNGINPKQIIEVGCGAGENLVELLRKDSSIEKLSGYDISPQAIELASKKTSDKIIFLNEDLTAKENVHSDLMLVIDVVEHVDNFYSFLRKIKSKSAYFIFHIPLDLSCRTIMKPHVLLQQRQVVGHIHYYTKEMVEWALKDTGYTIIDWVYTKPVVDVETAGSFKRFVKKVLRNVSFAINKNWSVKKWGGYSVMILTK